MDTAVQLARGCGSDSARLVVSVLVHGLILSLAGCASWRAVDVQPPGQYVQTAHPDRIRVVQAGGAALALQAPYVSGDSLIGVRRDLGGGGSGGPVALPLTSIRELQVRKVSAAKTGALVLGGSLLVCAALLLAAAALVGPGVQ